VWISKPILPANPQDSGWAGLLVIGSKCYLLTPHVASNGTDKPAVIGWRLTQADGTVYDLDAYTWSCDCPDATFRSGRPGPNGHGSNCRHAVGLRQALQLLSQVDDRPDQEPECDAFAGDSWDSPAANERYTLTTVPASWPELAYDAAECEPAPDYDY